MVSVTAADSELRKSQIKEMKKRKEQKEEKSFKMCVRLTFCVCVKNFLKTMLDPRPASSLSPNCIDF